jgi:hypothetical protein
LTAVARAEPSREASLAIKADLAKAQLALAQHNASAMFDALDDAMKYLSNADGDSVQALIAFQDQLRDISAETIGRPTVSSPPTSTKPVPSRPDQPAPPAAPARSSSGPFPEPVPPPASPASPSTSEPSADAALLSAPLPAPAPKSEPKVAPPPPPPAPLWPSPKTGAARPRVSAPERDVWSHQLAPPAQQPPRLALGARPWPYKNPRQMARTEEAPHPEPAPESLFRTAPQPPAPQTDGSGGVQRQPQPKVRADNNSSRKLLGYYAQDEDGKWVWLPVGSENGPPAPPDATLPPPR